MELILTLAIFQGIIGAFDLFYHHEYLEKLPWRNTASTELILHGVRNFFYAIVFLSFGWLQWHGAWAWMLAGILLIEVCITLWDFVEEDLSRKLPATERVSHTILALNYGAILALYLPILWQYAQLPTAIIHHDYGLLSHTMTLYAIGVFLWGIRDLKSGLNLRKSGDNVMQETLHLQKPQQQILVTGGTGFIGKPLCQSLIDDGHNVTILTRDSQKAAQHFNGNIRFVESIESLNEKEHFDVIINLAGEGVAQRWNEKSKQEILNSRLRITHALIDYLNRAEKLPEIFIHASAIGVYGLSDEQVFDEDSILKKTPESFSEEICFQRENSLDPIRNMPIRLCNIRIGLVMEKDGGVLGKLLFPFEFGMGGKVGSGKQWMSWIHRQDMLGILYFLINNKECEGTYNATAPQPERQQDFARILAKAMHRPAFMPLPAFAVKTLFGRMGEEFLLSGQKVLPKHLLDEGYNFQYPDLASTFEDIFQQQKGCKK